MIAAGVLLLLTLAFVQKQPMRPGPIILALGGIVVLWRTRRSDYTLAVWICCLSVIAASASAALLMRGLNNAAWIAVPLAVLVGSWVLGRRAAQLLVATTIAIIVFFTWLHSTGHEFGDVESTKTAAIVIITAILTAGLFGRVMAKRIQSVVQRVRESQVELSAIVDSTTDLVWSVEPDQFTLRSFNTQFLSFFGTTNEGRELTRGLSPAALCPDNPLAKAWGDLHRRAIESGGYTLEWSSADVETEFELRFNIMRRGDAIFGISAFAKDITQQNRARKQVEFLAYRDTLTRLPNRVLGIDRLEHAVTIATRHKTRLGLVYLDINDFKRVNETHGHGFGDEVLKNVALRLQAHLRGPDTLCRVSGNEFMLILPDLHVRQHLANVCERILSGLSKPMEVEGITLVCTASMGITVFPDDGTDRESLMRNAEMALHEAKRLGHGALLFYEHKMNENVARYVRIRDDLRLALERGEFVLHYQPQVDYVRHEVIGLEALLRWNHPENGLVMPGDFIEIAEETGLIVPIGAWVLDEACKQAAQLHRAGWPGLIMAVNLSAVQFRLGHIENDVKSALEKSAMDPTRLELELTESTLIMSADSFTEFTSRWKDQGIRIAIDDFGTGYSSLSYLKRFKVDKFKIDQSFVINIVQDEEDRAIVQAMIQIANSLRLEVTAEGVETAEVAEQLARMGCHQLQGFHIARPLAQERLGPWLQAYRDTPKT